MAGPEKQLEEKRKELEAVKEKAQEQLEKVHEVKRVTYLLFPDCRCSPLAHIAACLPQTPDPQHDCYRDIYCRR